MKRLKLVLTHDGRKWIARNHEFVATGVTLEELDENVRCKLKDMFKKGEKIEVKMEYDYRTFPLWMTQYHPYYLHRVIHVEL